MPTTAGTTARGLAYPGDSSAADVPAHLKALADSIEAMMNSALVLGSSLTALTTITAQGTGTSSMVLLSSSSGADLKRSRLLNDTGVTRLQSLTDAFALSKTGLTMDHATGVVDFPNGATVGAIPVGVGCFSAHRAAAASASSGGTTVAFDTEQYDTANVFNPATGEATIPAGQVWRLSWRVGLTSAGPTFLLADLTNSGGSVVRSAPMAQGSSLALSTGGQALATAGTYHVVASVNTGTPGIALGSSSCYFQGERVG